MGKTRFVRSIRVVLALTIVLSIGVLAGCHSRSATTPKKPPKVDSTKAKGAATIALSTLATTAPDGKVLMGELVAPVTATGTPMWQFLVGSPKTSIVYAVLINRGVGQYKEYAKVSLDATQWAKVPGLDDWKIDSDVALKKALALFPQGKNVKHMQGFLTYVPDPTLETAPKPMTWNVTFDPKSNTGKNKAPTSTVLVDMATGDTSFAETTKTTKTKE